MLTWASGTYTAQDVSSQTAYGIRELRESKTDILDIGSATSFANAYIDENSEAKRKIRIVVNSEYNIETIRP